MNTEAQATPQDARNELLQHHCECSEFTADVSGMVADVATANAEDEIRPGACKEALAALDARIAQGDAAAATALAQMLHEGYPMPRDDFAALELVEPLLALPPAAAARALAARIYRINKSYKKALDAAGTAFRDDHAGLLVEFGILHAEGLGTEKDELTAARSFRKAHEKGHALGSHLWAWALGHGKGVPADPAAAAGIYEAGFARNPSPQMARNAGYMWDLAAQAGHAGAREKEAQWVDKGASMGDSSSQQIVKDRAEKQAWHQLRERKIGGTALKVFSLVGRLVEAEQKTQSSVSGYGGAHGVPVRISTTHSSWTKYHFQAGDGTRFAFVPEGNLSLSQNREYRVLYCGHASAGDGYPFAIVDEQARNAAPVVNASTLAKNLNLRLPSASHGTWFALMVLISVVLGFSLLSYSKGWPVLVPFLLLGSINFIRMRKRDRIIGELYKLCKECSEFWARR